MVGLSAWLRPTVASTGSANQRMLLECGIKRHRRKARYIGASRMLEYAAIDDSDRRMNGIVTEAIAELSVQFSEPEGPPNMRASIEAGCPKDQSKGLITLSQRGR